MTLFVRPVGSRCWFIANEQLYGIVNAVMIEDSENVSYRVCWFVGGERKAEWLSDCELRFLEPALTKIGWKQGEP